LLPFQTRLIVSVTAYVTLADALVGCFRIIKIRIAV